MPEDGNDYTPDVLSHLIHSSNILQGSVKLNCGMIKVRVSGSFQIKINVFDSVCYTLHASVVRNTTEYHAPSITARMVKWF